MLSSSGEGYLAHLLDTNEWNTKQTTITDKVTFPVPLIWERTVSLEQCTYVIKTGRVVKILLYVQPCFMCVLSLSGPPKHGRLD